MKLKTTEAHCQQCGTEVWDPITTSYSECCNERVIDPRISGPCDPRECSH